MIETTDPRSSDATAIRDHISKARRVVVKVGSSSLASPKSGIDLDTLNILVNALALRQLRGSEVILVSSGAVAAGLEPLKFKRRPTDIPQQQAAAAVGQGLLMSAYTQAFAAHGIRTAQVLLTREDLSRKASYSNALRTFGALTRLRVVPIVNENDTVATRELRLGDNDYLAALVAGLVHADALVLLSDVDGLYTIDPSDPSAQRVDYVCDVAALDIDVLRPGSSGIGSGGMASKVEAARLAASAGIPVILARCNQAAAALAGHEVGTVFAASAKRLSRRQGWLAQASEIQGQLHVDDGAANALLTTAASLLAAGITQVTGDFHAGDSVEIVNADGEVIARGLAAFDSAELPEMLGHNSSELASTIGPAYSKPVVHRDDLVIS